MVLPSSLRLVRCELQIESARVLLQWLSQLIPISVQRRPVPAVAVPHAATRTKSMSPGIGGTEALRLAPREVASLVGPIPHAVRGPGGLERPAVLEKRNPSCNRQQPQP
jgi:hypothetical protein